MSDLAPLPQVLSRSDASNGAWTIEGGSCNRGDAWTNHSTKKMRVPLANTPEARVVRAHEMAHARVSPTWRTDTIHELSAEYGERVLACVEELRVNTIISRVGFDLNLLHDGSEKLGGTNIATTGGREMWNEAVSFSTACVGSPTALREFISGVRKGSSDWAKALSKMARQLQKVTDGITTTEMASTTPIEDGTPAGFVMVTQAIGRVLKPYLESAIGDGAQYTKELARQINRATEPGGRRAPTGRWADVVLLDLALAEKVDSSLLGRRRRPVASGTRVAFPSNAVRDPARRVFGGPALAPGGVVVIDQSGSMDLSSQQLDALLSLSPSLTVIGYSHRPGESVTTPNAWVLARGGRRVASDDLPQGNVGNGVDLPVLEFANRLRCAGEPLIWVCDGQTTDSNDHPHGAEEVALFIRRNRVHCVRSVDALLHELKAGRPVLSQMRMAEGRVGRAAIDVASTNGMISVDTTTPVTSRATGVHHSTRVVDAPVDVGPQELDTMVSEVVSYVAPYVSSYEATYDVGLTGDYSSHGCGVEL
jgi:hypothetical protein